MVMNLKTKVGIGVGVVVAAFAAGRYTAPAPEVKIVDQIKVNDTEVKNTKIKEHKVTVIEQTPTGAVTSTTTQDTDTEIVDNKQSTATESIAQVSKPSPPSSVNVAALVGYNFRSPTLTPPLGVSVSKRVIGPVTLGVFGYDTGLIGISIGLDF